MIVTDRNTGGGFGKREWFYDIPPPILSVLNADDVLASITLRWWRLHSLTCTL